MSPTHSMPQVEQWRYGHNTFDTCPYTFWWLQHPTIHTGPAEYLPTMGWQQGRGSSCVSRSLHSAGNCAEVGLGFCACIRPLSMIPRPPLLPHRKLRGPLCAASSDSFTCKCPCPLLSIALGMPYRHRSLNPRPVQAGCSAAKQLHLGIKHQPWSALMKDLPYVLFISSQICRMSEMPHTHQERYRWNYSVQAQSHAHATL